MRLYYHPESDSLFWDDFCDDPFVDDVTDEAKFQDAAAERGIFCPGPITKVIGGTVAASPQEIAFFKSLPADTPTEEIARQFASLNSGGLAGAIQASYKKWDRKPSDFYPTPYEGTQSLMPVIKTMLPNGGHIWEPCCGDFDMTRVLEWNGFEVTSTDIRDTGQGVGGFDFLHGDPMTELGWADPSDDIDMIVMNPPFSLAKEFIEKALSYTPNVACLLKIDYWNAISRYPLFQEKRPAFFMPLTWRLAFLKEERGNSPLMNCAWAVWWDKADPNECIFEPMPKLAYPGYQSDGVRTKLAKLGQALDDLTETLRGRSDA